MESFREMDYNAILGRLLRRQNIALMVRGVKITCTTILVLSIVVAFIIIIPDTIRTMGSKSELASKISDLITQPSNNPTQVVLATKEWDVLTTRQPFGVLGKVTSVTQAQPTPPPSPLMLALIGTFITQGQEPYAIIEDKKKQSQEMFLLNQSIFDQATLKRILKDRVEVERNGKLEVLMLDELGSAGGGSVSGNDSDEFVVEEAELDKGLENLPLLLTQARAVPYFKDGRSIGLRLFAIKTGSLYEKVGLRNGDILKSINGNNLGDISQALKLFEQLKQERSINLVLEREKQDREFKYTIR